MLFKAGLSSTVVALFATICWSITSDHENKLPLQTRWIPDKEWMRDLPRHGYPKNGYIPKRENAIRIGREFLKAYFGDKITKQAEPLDAVLIDDTWVVYGYLPLSRLPDVIVRGGTITVQLSKETGQVKRIDEEQ